MQIKDDIGNLYGTAAQVIPALLLILAVETTFMSAVLRYKGLWESGIGGLVTIRIAERLKRGKLGPLGSVFVPLGIPGRLMLATLATIADAFFLRPTRRTNLALAIMTILLAVVAEGIAFLGLAFNASGKAKAISVVTILIAIGVLLVEVLLSLVISVVSLYHVGTSPAGNGDSPGAMPTPMPAPAGRPDGQDDISPNQN